MALNWDWNECIGEAFIEEEGVVYGHNNCNWRIKLYEGNALLIALLEWDDKWSMHNFLIDLEHFKNCMEEFNWFGNIKMIKLNKLPNAKLMKVLNEAVKQGVKVVIAVGGETK